MVKPVPEGYRAVTPYLIVNGAAEAIAFYKNVFGAVEAIAHLTQPDGRIGHAELRIGDAMIMLADAFPERHIKDPYAFGGSPVSIHVYCEDADAVVARAAAAGATITRPVALQFYGDRSGGFTDPFGHTWYVATHVEDVSEEEMQRRAAAQHG